MMSAPNEKAVGDKRDAKYLAVGASYLFVPKNINLGRRVQKSATGPIIAASLAWEKKAEMKNENEISDMQNAKKYINNITGDEAGKNELWQRAVVLRAIQKKVMKAVRNHDSWWAQSCSPMIFITSRIRDSFSSTTDFTRQDMGYRVATTDISRHNIFR